MDHTVPQPSGIQAATAEEDFKWVLPRFISLWEELVDIGLESNGGYDRQTWTESHGALQSWFTTQATTRGMRVEGDGNGNLWAWLGEHQSGTAFATGSHFDSVPGGGGFDGPLGIVSAFAAIDLLTRRGKLPSFPLVVVNFAEEEGGRFGVPCLGSRLATGKIGPEAARKLQDRDGVSWEEAMREAGSDPGLMGPATAMLSRIGRFCELHIEQGIALAPLGQPVGVADAIWPHGRWRLQFQGQGNHAGTTHMADRQDPVVALGETILAVQSVAVEAEAVATVGKIVPFPNATNAVASSLAAWVDIRASQEAQLEGLWSIISEAAESAANTAGVEFSCTMESRSAEVRFDTPFGEQIIEIGREMGLEMPRLSTAAGHDAAVLAETIPSTMLFVRNQTGISHSPEEFAENSDCAIGVLVLASVLSAPA